MNGKPRLHVLTAALAACLTALTSTAGCEPAKERTDMTNEKEFTLTTKERGDLLDLARETVAQYVSKGTVPKIDASKFSGNARQPCGAFVTLHENGDLRGCIGNFSAGQPLYATVQQMAVASATEDPRFPAVKAAEVPKLVIEISALSPMRKIASPDEIVMGKHGIYVKKGGRGGTFLPQVAEETGWTREEFLGHCSRDKAGLGWDGWKDADIYVYTATVFSEKDGR